MPSKLKRRDDGTFTGKTGAEVEVALRSESPASTVRIIYAGEEDGEAPFTFDIKRGENDLLIVAVGADEDQKMIVVEVTDGEDARLKSFFWSNTRFFTTLTIEGK